MMIPNKNQVVGVSRNLTRPTSMVVMLLLFKAFKLIWPDAMPLEWQEITMDTITIVGGVGIIDKAWRVWGDNIKAWFKKIFRRKKKEVTGEINNSENKE